MMTSARVAVCAASLWVCGCAEPEPGVQVPMPPPTETQDIVDVIHGVQVADPYRWLEDQDAPETRAWIDAQNSHTDSLLTQLPAREELQEVVTRVLKRDFIGMPTERGGRYFFSKRQADQELSVIYVREGIHGPDRILIDPHTLSDDHTTSVALRDISHDGEIVVYAIRDGGVDEVSIGVLEVSSGEARPDVLPAARYGEIALTPSATGFFYERYGDVTPRVMYHELGADPSNDVQIFGDGYERHHIPVTQLSDDGRWLVVHVIEGSSGPTEIHVKDLERDTPFVTAIADGVSESWAEFAGDQLVITTNLDAPNKRVVLVDPAAPTVEQWREVVPERKDVVIQGARGFGGQLVLSYLRDVQPRMAIHDLSGKHLRDITFDTIGSVSGTGRWESDEAFLAFQTFHVPSTIYRYDLASGEREVWARVDVPVSAEKYEVEQVWFDSKDGTSVPMFVVRTRDVPRDGSRPTLLTGYGGFNLSRTPAFSHITVVTESHRGLCWKNRSV